MYQSDLAKVILPNKSPKISMTYKYKSLLLTLESAGSLGSGYGAFLQAEFAWVAFILSLRSSPDTTFF